MENKSRRNNIRIDGTPESLEEADWEATEEKVKRKSVERLNLRECPKTERARRTGPRKYRDGTFRIKPRT